MENQNKQAKDIDRNRRRFLTVMLVGSGAFLAERILSPLFSKFTNDPITKRNLSNKSDPGNFKVVQNKKSLSVYDGLGEEVLQIDKEV